MASAARSEDAELDGDCTLLLTVTIAAPSAGTVALTANSVLTLDRHGDKASKVVLGIEPAPAACAAPAANTAVAGAPRTAPSGAYDLTLTLSRDVAVPAGTHTFQLSGIVTSGPRDHDVWHGGTLRAVWYPA